MLEVALDWPSRQLQASIQLAQGGQLLLLGRSGAGKSTLLEAAAGLHKTRGSSARTSGPQPVAREDKLRVVWGEQSWCDSQYGVWVEPEARPIAMAFQTPRLFPHLTASGNVAFGISKLMAPEQRSGCVARAMQLVEAQELRDRKPAQLSGGEQMRISLARALARAWSLQAPLVLLDEPLTGLERALAERIAARLQSALQAHGATWVIATHHPALFRREASEERAAADIEHTLARPDDLANTIL